MYEQFHWTAPTGDVITLPHMDNISAGLIRKVRKLDDGDALFTILEEIADETTLAKIDKLDRGQFGEMAEAWEKAESKLGESTGSSTSSTPTGEPSSTTSAPASNGA